MLLQTTAIALCYRRRLEQNMEQAKQRQDWIDTSHTHSAAMQCLEEGAIGLKLALDANYR